MNAFQKESVETFSHSIVFRSVMDSESASWNSENLLLTVGILHLDPTSISLSSLYDVSSPMPHTSCSSQRLRPLSSWHKGV
jgi:hypothetical protein